MDRLKKLVKNNRFLMLLIYLPIYLAAFFIIDRLPADHFIIRCGIDRLIPFNEYFVIPYAFWFIWFPGVLFFFMYAAVGTPLKNDISKEAKIQSDEAKSDFIKLCTVMFSSMTLSLIIYVIFPNGIDLREPITGNNICAAAVEWIRAADTPYGVCPSIHVATIVSEALVIRDSKVKILNSRYKAAAYIITLLIVYSTMAVKQHSIIDAAAGAALAWVLYKAYPCAEKRIRALFI